MRRAFRVAPVKNGGRSQLPCYPQPRERASKPAAAGLCGVGKPREAAGWVVVAISVDCNRQHIREGRFSHGHLRFSVRRVSLPRGTRDHPLTPRVRWYVPRYLRRLFAASSRRRSRARFSCAPDGEHPDITCGPCHKVPTSQPHFPAGLFFCLESSSIRPLPRLLMCTIYF